VRGAPCQYHPKKNNPTNTRGNRIATHRTLFATGAAADDPMELPTAIAPSENEIP
jgi:hypothetical protein